MYETIADARNRNGRLITGRLALALVLLLSPAAAGAQRPVPSHPPEPRLVDTPWGDFPLGRLQPGARLRLTSADGQRVEARLITLGDSTLELHLTDGDSTSTVTLDHLRALAALEVRARPVWHERATTVGLIVGAVVGAIAGAAAHEGGGTSADGEDLPGLGEDVAASASLVGFFGWATGFYFIGRTRWRPVTLPLP